MAQNFLAIANSNRTDKINLYLVTKYDFLPWFGKHRNDTTAIYWSIYVR